MLLGASTAKHQSHGLSRYVSLIRAEIDTRRSDRLLLEPGALHNHNGSFFSFPKHNNICAILNDLDILFKVGECRMYSTCLVHSTT